ncbi:hypothetical protein OAV71_01170 [Opitutales bacterium]|nr:hypothetical protein [Opitutales bacterium]
MIIKYNVTLLLLIFFCRFSFADTYIWEDYDDFSGSTLDTSKWGTMYLGGGIEPHVTDGKLVLSGGVGNPSASKVVKTGWTEIFKGDDGGQAWIYAKGTEVYGIEAEFIIPSAASSMSGLQLGIASLNPLSYATVELNAEPNSASKYSQGFGFYHLLNGSETEKFGSTQRDITHKLGASLIDGRLKLFVDGEVKYEADSETFNTDMFFLNGFNDYQAQGLAFELNADNVRVLRRSQSLPQISVAPEKIEAERDLVYLQSPNGPSLLAGAGEINLDMELVDQPTVSASTLKVDGEVFDLVQNQGPVVFRTRYGYGTGELNELYDIESSSSSDWSAYANGIKFEFSLTINGSEYTYFHDLPGEAELPSAPSPSISGAESWKKDQDGYDYVTVSVAENYVVSWDPFITSDSRDYIGVSLVELIGDEEKDILGDVILTAATSSYEISGNLLEKDKSYLFYVGFSNVVQSENPTGFTHSVGSNTTESLLRTSANSITALGFMIEEAETVTVVSDPNGQAVVVQVGNEYQWNSTLDGVTLWMVHEDDDDGWFGATIQYVSGIQKGSIGLTDQLGSSLEVNHPYIIDENGMIKVTEDTGYQYYQVTSVENGVIITADDSSFPLSDTSRFFTTRAAAEEYYYSQVGYPNPNGWLWFDHYPWVYSHKEQGWLYFKPSGGKLMYFSHKNKIWREFSQ